MCWVVTLCITRQRPGLTHLATEFGIAIQGLQTRSRLLYILRQNDKAGVPIYA